MPAHKEGINYIVPISTMRLLVNEQGESSPVIPNHQSIEYFILQETISDTMQLFEVNRKDCARYLLSIPTSFDSKLFKSPPPPVTEEEDDIKTEPMDLEDGKWNLPDLLVEVQSFIQAEGN